MQAWLAPLYWIWQWIWQLPSSTGRADHHGHTCPKRDYIAGMHTVKHSVPFAQIKQCLHPHPPSHTYTPASTHQHTHTHICPPTHRETHIPITHTKQRAYSNPTTDTKLHSMHYTYVHALTWSSIACRKLVSHPDQLGLTPGSRLPWTWAVSSGQQTCEEGQEEEEEGKMTLNTAQRNKVRR